MVYTLSEVLKDLMFDEIKKHPSVLQIVCVVMDKLKHSEKRLRIS